MHPIHRNLPVFYFHQSTFSLHSATSTISVATAVVTFYRKLLFIIAVVVGNSFNSALSFYLEKKWSIFSALNKSSIEDDVLLPHTNFSQKYIFKYECYYFQNYSDVLFTEYNHFLSVP